MLHAINIYIAFSAPNISTPNINEAIGVFVAPAKTPINPRDAKKDGDILSIVDNVFPRVDPITKSGVTSPP